MVRKPVPQAPEPARLNQEQILKAIPALERRINEFEDLKLETLTEENGDHVLSSLAQKTNQTLRDIFGHNTIEYTEYEITSIHAYSMVIDFHGDIDDSFRARISEIRKLINGAVSSLQTARDILQERLTPDGAFGNQVLRAYEGLDLHPEIARAASKRYQDGHYADAVEAAVKGLNNLVRLRSGSDLDGTKLMESVFSPNAPELKFNALADQSDKDEQKGFMMLFSGAVAGLRNPRAHKFIQDDPERALEFIAFVSLLAKLLDGAR
ncbi:MAG TPA: TIGR02391 family protein [Pseudolabrys sp.]|jgi:uncharacterized protein (TIGR02391 family)|nr:TIGR02391 family protein [Pseudolabrys sp.]